MDINLAKARQHFLATDPVMSELMAKLDEREIKLSIPKASPPTEYGTYLVRAIISQQLSTKAAATITERVCAHAGSLDPGVLATCTDTTLRQAGLSAQKVRYVRELAEKLPGLDCASIRSRSNADIVAMLTTIPGIGTWTAEMFLIFALGRSDVFTLRDLGLHDSLHHYYRLQHTHHKKRDRIIASWQEHKTVASLVLWKARDIGLPRH